MEVILKKVKKGRVLVLVRFKKDTNFNPENLEWVPRLEEIDLIVEAKNRIMTQHER